ncbi:hypothetical protein PYW07_004437 [Mythimna separata]|uniref:Peptidase metallopeptidase domain-containing protein n=1 Tax=Mythimna separata TaxID=271217 RepID=A0AAD7YZ48_MYTSE|nr:hypothetical protein PYW07_004437 [Mythimna separata]
MEHSADSTAPSATNTHSQTSCLVANTDRVAHDNHSNDNLEHVHKLTDLDRCRILNKEQIECQHESERRCSATNRPCHRASERCVLHNKEDVYGKESITRKRVEVDECGSSRRAADLKFKCSRDAQEWTGALGRTIGVRVDVLVIAVVALFLSVLATCAAAPAPARSRPTRSAHEKIARSYLETFGYLKKGRPEVGNLQVMGHHNQEYEDDFRIAIRTLQQFGGIPVTGKIDRATAMLMKQKRCGRPDREDGDNEHRRTKRFAVQGEKWKYTNLTWSLSSSRRPSQLDPHQTRGVLARALDVWAQASRLTFTEVNSDEADIVVSFAKRFHDDAYPFDGRGSILAHAFFPGTGRGGDAHFDDDELWLLQPRDDDEEGTSLFAVAAHEFGHSLGLSHSSVKGALMFPWYQGIQPNFVLPEDDRNGIQQMYGPKKSTKWAKIPYYRPVEPPPTTTTTTTSTTTTTTTRRPVYRHPNDRTNNRRYTPTYPRPPVKYPTVYHPVDRPNHYPDPVHPGRRHDDRRTYHHHPTETSPRPTTYRPRYPPVQPEYPNPRQHYPNDPRQDNPRKPTKYYPERTTQRTTTTTPSDKPDTCDTTYDAVALIRGELFIFKNRYHWRIGAQGRYTGYPMEITRMWSSLPRNLTHVDAVYERPDRKIAIFIGKKLYLFDTQYLLPGYPKPLSTFGLPESLEKLDAAMVWGHNGNTYFYSGTMYWKYDEEKGRVDYDYPRNMAMWKGVGYHIDSVFQWKDGKTYFFKGKGFWKFNDLHMRVETEEQLPSATFWMGCTPERSGRRAGYKTPPAPGSTLRSPSAATTITTNLLPFLYSTLLLLTTYIRYC